MKFNSLIVAVLKRISVEHCYSIYAKNVRLISSDSQRQVEMVFVVQLQTLHEISHRARCDKAACALFSRSLACAYFLIVCLGFRARDTMQQIAATRRRDRLLQQIASCYM